MAGQHFMFLFLQSLREQGEEVEDGGRYGDRAVGLSHRRERLVSKEMCVRDESV